METAAEAPLQEVLQALSRTPVTHPQLRAALATTCARWYLLQSNEAEAIRHLGHALEMVPDLRPAMRLLYRTYLSRGDVRSAVMYLDQEIRATRHPREAAALYRERGQLVEAHFHDLNAAQQCYQAALKATPRDLAVLRSVERVALARGDVFWLIANLETQLDVLQDEAATAGVLHDLALLEARHKGDLMLAGDLLLAALERFGGHLVLADDLFRVAEVAGDAELMLQALELEAEFRPPEGKALALARASVTLREHRERSAALELLRSAALSMPDNYSLWRSLEELAMTTSRYDVALEACVGQLKCVGDQEDPGARAEILYRLGKLALFRLDRGIEGLSAMRKALKLMPGHPLVMEDTGRYLNAGGMWAQQLELIKFEVGSAARIGLTSEEVALCHLRAGQVMEERLGELDGARKAYEEAIAADKEFRPPRDRLERVLHQMGAPENLRTFYADELEVAKTPARRMFLRSVLGQLHSSDEDPTVAIEHLQALLDEQPNHLSSVQLLARLLARAGRNDKLLDLTEREVGLTSSPTRRAKLLHRSGEIALGLGDVDRARAAFEQALENVDDHLPSLESYGNLLRDQKDYAGLVELLRKELLYSNDRARQVALQLEIATILSQNLGDQEAALVELRALLKRWPRHLPALHAAEGLAARLGRTDDLLALIEQHVATVTGDRTRALLLHRAATVRIRQGDNDGAVRELERALELWPQLGVARTQLLRLYEKLGRSRDLQQFAESGLTEERGADDRRAMALQLAELSPRPVVAIQYLGAVAEARPEDYVTQLRLARACRHASRPSREAGALRAAANRFAQTVPATDPAVAMLRLLAGRAEEAAGNLDTSDKDYAKVLDLNPENVLAQRARLRVKRRQKEAGLERSAEDYESIGNKETSPVVKASLLNVSAELHERRQDLRTALRKLDAALKAFPGYIPALHAKARVLERMGQDNHLFDAIETLEALAGKLSAAHHKAAVLCHAGTLALRVGHGEEPNPRAWKLFAHALEADPSSPRAIRGLRRTRDAHGTKGAPALNRMLRARVEAMRDAGELSTMALRELVRLGSEVDGPRCAVDLLELGMTVNADDATLHTDLARAYARLDRWSDAVASLDQALANEASPERIAALHYYSGEANQKAGNTKAAIDHYLESGRTGFQPRHALAAADRLAASTKALDKRVEALELLVDVAPDSPERNRGLRTLADLYRGPLHQPDRAVELMRELLLLRPTDHEVLLELWRLLGKLERSDEALATLMAGVAHHRAWLRSTDGGSRDSVLSARPVYGLLRLFDAMRERTGVYLSACILETLDPKLLHDSQRPNRLVHEPWPLPRPQSGRPFDGLIGDLPCSAALDLLRDGVFFLGSLPLGPTPIIDLSPSRALPSNNAVVMVTRALARAMGVPHPLVFTDDNAEDTVAAYISPAPALVVGRRVAAGPADPVSRDALGRALLRLATGGDAIHRHASPEQLYAILVALAAATGVDIETTEEFDEDFAADVANALPGADELGELHDTAVAFRDTGERFEPGLLVSTLHMAEDRAGAVCSGDPRPALSRVFSEGIDPMRGRMLTGYLLSDDHLSLRVDLGYHFDPELASAQPREARA
jgi:tetratricopeptide (TPR) repeat protein